jgi:addiction module HigA family antidote
MTSTRIPGDQAISGGSSMELYAIHPGEFLAEELDERDMTGSDLARALNIPQNRISEILNGKRSITVDTALRLAQWMGSSAQYWLNLQQIYDLRVAEEQIGEEIRRTVQRDATTANLNS